MVYVVRIELVEEPGPNDMRVSPRMANVLERAAAIGLQHTGAPLVGTETVLRALTDDPDGIAAQVLDEVGCRAKTRRRLDQILKSPGYSPGVSKTTS